MVLVSGLFCWEHGLDTPVRLQPLLDSKVVRLVTVCEELDPNTQLLSEDIKIYIYDYAVTDT